MCINAKLALTSTTLPARTAPFVLLKLLLQPLKSIKRPRRRSLKKRRRPKSLPKIKLVKKQRRRKSVLSEQEETKKRRIAS